MKVGKKLFPYPTLNNQELINSYIGSNYSLVVDLVITEDKLILKNAHIEIENQDIELLLQDGRAKAILIIECSQTVFRKALNIGVESQDIEFSIGEFNGKVEISSYIYATTNIENFTSEYFLEDYQDYSFNIEKYDILAIDDGFTTKIIYNEEEDKKISSIFSIIPNNVDDSEDLKVSSGQKQIIIQMPLQYYGYHDNMKQNDNFQNIFFGIIAIPALSTCLQEIKEHFEEQYSESLEEVILDKTWFNSVMDRYKIIHDEAMTSNKFKELDSYSLAQELLNYGSSKGIGDLYKMILGDGGDLDD